MLGTVLTLEEPGTGSVVELGTLRAQRDRHLTLGTSNALSEEDRRAIQASLEAMEVVSDELKNLAKSGKSFRETFKNSKEFPTFNGNLHSWWEFKKKLISFIGYNNVKELIVWQKDFM